MYWEKECRKITKKLEISETILAEEKEKNLQLRERSEKVLRQVPTTPD